jgi:hypothetical protein
MIGRARTLCLAAVLSFGVFVAEGRAASISIAPDSSASFDIYWSLLVGSVDLNAIAQFDVTVTDAYVDLVITLSNDTDLESEKVHSIGFNTAPNATSLSNPISGEYFQNFKLNQNFPSFQKFDVCAWGTQNCSGGGQSSNLPGGENDTFGFRLNGNFSNGIVLDNFVIKFQGDLGSFQFNDTPPSRVPEPSTLLLLGLGAVVSAVGARRRSA